MGLYDYTLYSFIHRNALVHGERVCLKAGEESVSHARFKTQVDALTAGLCAAGLKRGDRLAVLSLNNLEYMYLYGAASKAGLILVPLNFRLAGDELQYALTDSGARALVVDTEHLPVGRDLAAATPELELKYVIGEPGGEFLPFDDLLTGEHPDPGRLASADDGLVMIHTAAVAVHPRGVLLSQRNLLTANVAYQYNWAITPDDVHLCLLPLFHILGLGMALAALQAGAANILLPRFEAESSLRAMQDDRATFFGGFPPIFQTILDTAQAGNYDVSSVRFVVGLDKAEVIEAFQKMSGAEFWSLFGQTETSGLVTLMPYGQKAGAAGIPVPFAELGVVDEADELLPPGRTGEIVVRGPMVFQGYWNLARDNAFTFRNGWHHTGDMGWFDEEGYLYYKGRAPYKELIKPGGENVYPGEVEKALLAHADIAEAVVIGVRDEKWGEAVKAVCVPVPGRNPSVEDVIEFVGGRIARYKKPKIVVFVDQLPKDDAGAVDRGRVKAEHGSA